jgi:hypothetical protein
MFDEEASLAVRGGGMVRLAEPYFEFWERVVAPTMGTEEYHHRLQVMRTTIQQLQARVRLLGTGVKVTHAPRSTPQTRRGNSCAK